MLECFVKNKKTRFSVYNLSESDAELLILR